MLRLYPLLLLGLLLLPACTQGDSKPQSDAPSEPAIPFRTDGRLDILRGDDVLLTLDIEIAESDSARERGLMQRASLPDRSGMLFLFDREEMQTFWMANTPLALDLIFISADSEIVSIAKYARPFSDDQIASEAPAQYVLEVPAGFTDTHGLIATDRVRWQRTPGNGSSGT